MNLMAAGTGGTGSQKCASHEKFSFERVPNFEPVGGYLSLLYIDSSNPGIVSECISRCTEHPHCLAFIVDYNQRSCHGIFETSPIGRFDLRLSIGKDYFEGFCAPSHLTCNKLWMFDRIVDQAVVGPANPKRVIRYITRRECKIRCFEETRFHCASASFDGHYSECKLFDTDRHSGAFNLLFTKEVDYLENQCAFDGSKCK